MSEIDVADNVAGPPETAKSIQSEGNDLDNDTSHMPAPSLVRADIDSDVQEERIQARRLRIAKRREDERRKAAGIAVEETVVKTNPALEPHPEQSNMRIATSHQTLDRLREQGMDRVTLVRVTADYAESKRRREEKTARTQRRQQLQDERDATMQLYERVHKMLEEAAGLHTAPELHEALLKQQEACKELIAQKDTLITDFQKQLKSKDDEYVRSLRAQTADIDTVLSYMDQEVRSLTSSYKQELEDIESTFMKERQELVTAARQEWQEAMTKRREDEIKYLEDARERVEEQEKQLEHLRVTDLDEYNIIKRKLETDIHQLQQQLQNMKATYQLNTEKLEYNYQILKKRDEENAITISQQKRKLNKLTDAFNNLLAKIAKQEALLEQENVKLTQEFTKAADHFQDLQKKARHFTALDRRQIDEVWQMNEDSNVKLAKQLLAADQAIHEQQLGVQWVRPLEVLFDSTATEQQVRSRAASAVARELMEGRDVDNLNTGHLSAETLRRALELLCEEGDFLVESQFDVLLGSLEAHERTLLRLDAMFKALAINTEEDMKQLAMYFISPDQTPEVQDDTTPRSSQIKLIDRTEVTAALRRFVDSRGSAAGANATLGVSPGLAARNPAFWERLANVVPLQHERCYGALRDAMEKYHDNLTRRAAAITDVDNLKQQNSELRMLLKQYMASNVNKALVVPPTAVLAHQVRQEQSTSSAATQSRAAMAATIAASSS
eukprot:TRINITY_DN8455_c0_g1_i1.p1 TRINITY_DN8455_c0_g1~~TRINITY_DN8455_c0_g1_i1.p1  ORF type:complete len:755 (+),score=242.01 TRINITY_DN8455_c0_g1_i1:85-2265(+)